MIMIKTRYKHPSCIPKKNQPVSWKVIIGSGPGGLGF